jgi:hypothetical protein
MNFMFQKQEPLPLQIQLEIPPPPPPPPPSSLPGKDDRDVMVIDLNAEEEDSEGVVFIRW